MLQNHVREQVAQVLHCAPAEITPHVPLPSFGIDSLMALEFRNRIEASLGLTLSATLIWKYPTIAELAAHLAGEMGLSSDAGGDTRQAGAAAAQPTRQAGSSFDALLAAVEELPDDEVESKLEEMRRTRARKLYE
jgi:acyl carrier protein